MKVIKFASCWKHVFDMTACLCAVVFVCSAARAGDDFPEECNGAYMVQVLGTVLKSCPDLRVTTAGVLFTGQASKQPSYKRCQEPAKARLFVEVVSLAAKAEGDAELGMRLWCMTALATFDIIGGGLIVPK